MQTIEKIKRNSGIIINGVLIKGRKKEFTNEHKLLGLLELPNKKNRRQLKR